MSRYFENLLFLLEFICQLIQINYIGGGAVSFKVFLKPFCNLDISKKTSLFLPQI